MTSARLPHAAVEDCEHMREGLRPLAAYLMSSSALDLLRARLNKNTDRLDVGGVTCLFVAERDTVFAVCLHSLHPPHPDT